MVIGKAQDPHFFARNMALLSSCPAMPRRDRETAATSYTYFLQEQIQKYLRNLEPHPPTLTQRPKITEEAPPTKRQDKYPKNCPFPNKTWLQVGNELDLRAFHPSSHPCLQPLPVQKERRNIWAWKVGEMHEEEGDKIRGPASRLGQDAQERQIFASGSKGA